jgi:hypothetical protein
MVGLCLMFQTESAEQRDGNAKKLPPGVRALDAPGLHNVFSIGTNVFSGSSPEGEEAFQALAKLGVKTMITVDGAKPNVETARRYGIRYVHLPHGYDGISTDLQLQLAKAADTLPGGIYVHCHHGKHRGPAAAALICMSKEGWTPKQAEAWLVAAGTATNYAGLYDVVRGYRKPSPQQLAAVSSYFPETAEVSGLVDAMVGIDERWEHLKAVRAARYQAPNDHPDIQPVNEAVILWEHYREAQRLPESARKGDDFIQRLKNAESEVKEAERLLRFYASDRNPAIRLRLDSSFDSIGKTCASCHKAFRDAAGIRPGS